MDDVADGNVCAREKSMKTYVQDIRLSFGWRRRLMPVHQIEAAECGLACLAMLSGFYGGNASMDQLRSSGSGARGSTLGQLVGLASRFGMTTRPVRLELEELNQIRVPFVAHVDGDHFVIVENVRRKKIEIVDPAIGRLTLSMTRFSEIFTGVALEVTDVVRPERTEIKDSPKLSVKKVLGNPKNLTRIVLLLFILSFFVELTVLAIPALIQVVVDQTLNSTSFGFIFGLVVCFCAIMLVQMSATFCRSWATTCFNHEQGTIWSQRLLGHLLNLPHSYFVGRGVGTIRTSFESLETVKSTLSTAIVTTFVDGMMAILAVAILFRYSSRMAWVVVFGAAVYLLVRALSYEAIRSSSIDIISLKAKETSIFVESVRAIETLRMNNAQLNQSRRYFDSIIEIARKSASLESMTLVFGSTSIAVTTIVKASIIYYGVLLIDSHELTMGMLVAFLAYSDQFIGRVSRVVDAALELKILGVHLERLSDISLHSPEKQSGSSQSIDRFESISISNCGYRYGENLPWIFKDLNVTVRGGESIALMGPSGAGKSTLVKILNATLAPQVGSVLINNYPYHYFSPEQIRERIAVVAQGDILLSGTIDENIASFDSEIDQERVIAASKAACIYSEIASIPMGFSTRVSDGTMQLSGGQVQRICIARAIYRKPDVMVLDEGTGNLDQSTEKQVIENIKALGLTLVLVTHRDSAARHVDRILRI
jgi:ATP-binding cassette subfamily B protein RaxB